MIGARPELGIMNFAIYREDGGLLTFSINGSGVLGDGCEYVDGDQVGVPVAVRNSTIYNCLERAADVYELPEVATTEKQRRARLAFLIRTLLRDKEVA